MAGLAVQERAFLVSLLTELGPDQPTLCTGWATRDLAAHLVARERRVDAAPGIMIKAIAPHLARVQARLAARPWPALLARLARSPFPLRVTGLDEAINTVEFFIHTEDVRRAQPTWAPRPLPEPLTAALWAAVAGIGPRQALRAFPATVHLDSPGRDRVTRGRGGPEVTVEGAPGELLLFFSGRQPHAVVTLAGPEELTGRLRAARFGV